jgi:hypothetical protein
MGRSAWARRALTIAGPVLSVMLGAADVPPPKPGLPVSKFTTLVGPVPGAAGQAGPANATPGLPSKSVPSFKGDTRSQAEALAVQYDLRPRFDPDPTPANATVVDQNPRPGEPAQMRSFIFLTMTRPGAGDGAGPARIDDRGPVRTGGGVSLNPLTLAIGIGVVLLAGLAWALRPRPAPVAPTVRVTPIAGSGGRRVVYRLTPDEGPRAINLPPDAADG